MRISDDYNLLSNHKLTAQHKAMDKTELAIRNECVTRWSSLCVMIERLLHARLPIAATLALLHTNENKVPTNLSEEQWNTLQQLLTALEPLQQISDYLQTQEVPTIGVIFPVMQGLLSHHLDTTAALESRRAQEPEPRPPITPIDRFKAYVGDHIKKKFDETIFEWERELLLSVLLDPRAKDFYFIKDENQRAVLLRQAEQYAIEELGGGMEEILESGSVRPTSSQQSLGGFLSGLLGPEPQAKSGPEEELRHYRLVIRVPILVQDTLQSPLNWWRNNVTNFPLLASLAKKYLVMMVSSASIERTFSLAGWVVDKRRCSLRDSSIEDRLMVIANKKHLV